MKRILLSLNMIRTILLWMLIYGADNKELIYEEIAYWYKITHWDSKKEIHLIHKLNWVCFYERAYRNLLAYRLQKFKDHKLVNPTFRSYLCKLVLPGEKTLIIAANEIGKNLYIQHGFSCCITARIIGENCWINQQVTIGYTFAPYPPVIGNGVRISAGAKVLGDIYIGDNVIIAANAVVVQDVDQELVVGGVPAKKIGTNDAHKLYKKEG